MVVYFETEYLEKLFTTPLDKIRGKHKVPVDVIKQYQKRVQMLMDISGLEALRGFGGMNFEYLKGDRKGQCSIRLNYHYRLLFSPINEKQVQVLLIQEISNHYA
jgi:plasmid maintenance system killer protein